MMRVDTKRLSEAQLTMLRERSEERGLSRRAQALLASAWESGPVTPRWYVLSVAPGEDIAVDNALANAGVEHWMATEKKTAKWRGGRRHQRFCAIVKPTFAGYMFVRVAWGEMAWKTLSGIEGVDGIVGGAISPAPLRDKEFDKFRARADEDPNFLRALSSALREGDAVRIDEGPFAHFAGIVLALFEKTSRAMVEVDIFGRKTPVDLELAQIEKLD